MEHVIRELTAEETDLISGGSGNEHTKYVTTANVHSRSSKSADSSANIILTIPKGKAVTFLGEDLGWDKVKYSGKFGYIRSGYLEEVTI